MENETNITEPIVIKGIDDGVHVCRPSEYSFWVFAMQYLLKANNYYVQADGYYAIDTAKWLKQFKEDHGLDPTPLCDEQTWNMLFANFTLSIGDEGYAVRAMQYLLKAQDYFIYTDQIFGAQCYKQLCNFQAARHMEETGTCDNNTWNELIRDV